MSCGRVARLVTLEEEAAATFTRDLQAYDTPGLLLVLCNRVELMRTTISFLNVEQNTPESRL